MKGALLAFAGILGCTQAWAAEAPYLEGTFYLDMETSRWGGGVNGAPGNPEPPGTHHITGGTWTFDKDDGKHRKGSLMQTLRGGKIQSFYYDVPYDGRMYWLNDWYQESSKRIDDKTFEVSWAVIKDGKRTHSGGPAVCKINDRRDSFVCDDVGLREVYSKTAKPPVMPGPAK